MGAILCVQPRRSRECKQEVFKCELGLKQREVISFFQVVGRGSRKMKITVLAQLLTAGVDRVLGSSFPTKGWWLAFIGTGGTTSKFVERGEYNSFTRQEDCPTAEKNLLRSLEMLARQATSGIVLPVSFEVCSSVWGDGGSF